MNKPKKRIDVSLVKKLLSLGFSRKDIAKELDVNVSSIYRVLDREKEKMQQENNGNIENIIKNFQEESAKSKARKIEVSSEFHNVANELNSEIKEISNKLNEALITASNDNSDFEKQIISVKKEIVNCMKENLEQINRISEHLNSIMKHFSLRNSDFELTIKELKFEIEKKLRQTNKSIQRFVIVEDDDVANDISNKTSFILNRTENSEINAVSNTETEDSAESENSAEGIEKVGENQGIVEERINTEANNNPIVNTETNTTNQEDSKAEESGDRELTQEEIRKAYEEFQAGLKAQFGK